MGSIRKTKKIMKKSSGFFTVFVSNGMGFCSTEWGPVKYHRNGISVGYAEYLPYNIMRKVIPEVK